MNNLFSRSEIYELKKMINKQKKSYISNYELNKESKVDKIESLNNFNKVLLNIEKDMNSKTIKILK